MLFADVVATSAAVAATSGRSAKRDAIAALLGRADATEIEPVVGFLVGEPRQGRIGIGWRTLANAERAGHAGSATSTPLTVADVDEAITTLAGLSGPGSTNARRDLLADLLSRATPEEVQFLTRLFGGELRQGALSGVMTDAVAKASGVAGPAVRRAVMLGGRLDAVARLALTEGKGAVQAVGLTLGQPVQPMLASTAGSVAEAMEAIGEASVEWKLDGIRIQVHRVGDRVQVWTRNLNDITERLGGVVDVVRALPADRLVLDGEALVVGADDRPVLFQDTVSWRARQPSESALERGEEGSDDGGGALRPFFFDVLHVDGHDLIDAPLVDRLAELDRVTGPNRIPGRVTTDADEGSAVLADALAAGHEGAVVKSAASPYEAGRRGKAWRKVKPVHTLDLVVLAVEWGHGRRTGWLSNLHLGARDPDRTAGAGELVMVGKTFKGLTDELLRWQTERFLALAEREEDWGGPQTGVVWVRPEQVVEIAVDGVQRSTRYPGGVALRFARVVRYRHDKDAADADLLSAVQALMRGPS